MPGKAKIKKIIIYEIGWDITVFWASTV